MVKVKGTLFSLHPSLEEAIKPPQAVIKYTWSHKASVICPPFLSFCIWCWSLSTLVASKLFLEVTVLALCSSRHCAQVDEMREPWHCFYC